MGSSDTPSEAEQRAFDAVSFVTGARIDHTDGISAPPGAVDASLTYPDGRTGWLEVSTLGVPTEFELQTFLPRESLPSPGIWDWTVMVEGRADLQRAQTVVNLVVAACEQVGVAHPGLLPEDVLAGDEDLQWAANNGGAVFFGIVMPTGARAKSPSIHFRADDFLASSRFGDMSVTAALNSAFGGDVLRRRIEKLAASDADERHLYLRVTKGGIGEGNLFVIATYSFDIEDAGLEDHDLTAADPSLPEAVTHLWLDTHWGTRVTRWTRGQGWDHPSVSTGSA